MLRENSENKQKNLLSEKTQGIWKCCQSTGNFVCSCFKFCNSKYTGNAIFVAKLFSKLVSHIELALISEIGTVKISSWTGKKQE